MLGRAGGGKARAGLPPARARGLLLLGGDGEFVARGGAAEEGREGRLRMLLALPNWRSPRLRPLPSSESMVAAATEVAGSERE